MDPCSPAGSAVPAGRNLFVLKDFSPAKAGENRQNIFSEDSLLE